MEKNVQAAMNRLERRWFENWLTFGFVRTYIPPPTPKTARLIDLLYYDPDAAPESRYSFESLTTSSPAK